MGPREVPDVNGKMIIEALEGIGQPATAKRICSYIANSAGISTELIKNSVDSVLKGGLDNGFIKKHKKSYYIESSEETEEDLHYYICKKCRNQILTSECATENTEGTKARAGAAKTMKNRNNVKKTTSMGQKKKPVVKNVAPKQADSKVKSVAVLKKKKELNTIRNIRASRFGNKSKVQKNISKPQEKKVASKRAVSKIKSKKIKHKKANESKVLKKKMGSFSVRARKASERKKKLSKKQPTDPKSLERKIRAAQKVATKTKNQSANKSSPIKDCGNDGMILRSGLILKNINHEPKNKEQKNSESINKDKDKNLASKENKLAQKPAKAAVNTHEASNGDRQKRKTPKK